MHINKLLSQVNPQCKVLPLALDGPALKRSYRVMCKMQVDCKVAIATTELAPVTIYCSLVWLVPLTALREYQKTSMMLHCQYFHQPET